MPTIKDGGFEVKNTTEVSHGPALCHLVDETIAAGKHKP
jgi:hypothetical protein